MPNNRESENVNVPVNAIAELIQAVKDTAPPRKVSAAQREPKSPFAQGKTKRQRAKLKVIFYQNGYRVNPKVMFDNEIEMANKLVPGKYAGGLLNVTKVLSQTTDPDKVNLNYNNAKPDQRMAMMQLLQGGGLPRMLEICTKEAEARRAKRDTESA